MTNAPLNSKRTRDLDPNRKPYLIVRHRHQQRQQHPNKVWLALPLGFFTTLFLVFFFIMACTIGSAVAGYAYLSTLVPTEADLTQYKASQSSKIYDRQGNLLFELFDANNGRRTDVSPEKIPTVLKQAIIATEDPTFYDNPGIDSQGILRAVYYLWKDPSRTVGGSTITQQLVKTTLLTPEVTITRKLKEAVYSIELTRRYTKAQILALYLNSISFGNLSYGVQAASQGYFKKDVSDLDLAEASLLAGLPQAPSLYDPCRDMQAALDRQQIVLQLMNKEQYISLEQAAQAASETRQLLASDAFQARCQSGIAQRYPHFVEYVRQELEKTYGPELLYRGGLSIYTSLDPSIQAIAEDEARKQIASLKAKNVHSAAVVVANPDTGEIYAMVGSVDFYDKSIDGQVNVANRLRQPGSSIKPINYVAALEKGWTLATPLYDIRTEFPDTDKPYVPIDYDEKEHGIVTVRTALANSYNIPAVKTLYFVTVQRMIASAERFGITSFGDPSRYGLSLTLGGGEVTLVQLTGAYAVFANRGQRVPLTPFTKITDAQGNVLFDIDSYSQNAPTVVDPRYAYLITSVLSDNKARTPAFGQNSPLKLCLDGTSTCKEDQTRPTAAKTGTTNDFRDNWTLGYTPELVVGVWVGNPRNEVMEHSTGITGAAPIWQDVMARIYGEIEPFKSVTPHPFEVPAGLVQATVCSPSGLLATSACPASKRFTEIFLAEQAPKPDDSWVNAAVDRSNGLLAGPGCPPDAVETRSFVKLPQDVYLPYPKILDWGSAHGYSPLPIESSPCGQAAMAMYRPPNESQPGGNEQSKKRKHHGH